MFPIKIANRIKKIKHKENILVHYQSWIVDGSGSTSALFTGSYDELQDVENYRIGFIGKVVYLDKIAKEDVNGETIYLGVWLDIETNEYDPLLYK